MEKRPSILCYKYDPAEGWFCCHGCLQLFLQGSLCMAGDRGQTADACQTDP